MSSEQQRVRVLYSFPHKLGAGRICYTAWQQVNGLAAAGADVLVYTGSVHKPLSANVEIRPTLARGKFRIPYKVFGKFRALALHDYIVSRRIEKLANKIDIIHTWPMAALRTLNTAARLGIPTVLERPNAHTLTYYETVQRECHSLDITLPRYHEHAYNQDVVRTEEAEYQSSFRLLCPSDFVVRTFLRQGFPVAKLARHRYGYDENIFYPKDTAQDTKRGLTILFVGVCVPAKGVHYAVQAWLRSPAHCDGTFLIAGNFLPSYAERLSTLLSDPSVRLLGYRDDVPELMRQSDLLVFPSLGEGFGLVCAEAMGSGCVPLVSDACTDICKHLDNALVHPVGDVEMLTRHITMLYQDRGLLERLRASCLRTAPEFTWTAAGARLLQTYRDVIAAKQNEQARVERDGVETAHCLA